MLCSHQMEVDARRLRKAMEASPLEQSEELIAKLKTPEGAGQKGCKWVWRQHEWDGTLCYFNKETEEVLFDHNIQGHHYKTVARDNWVAREVQELLDRLTADKDADKLAWDRDAAARCLQRLYKTHQCRKALDKVLYKAHLKWLRNEEKAKAKVAIPIQRMWRARAARKRLLAMLREMVVEEKDGSGNRTGVWLNVSRDPPEKLPRKPALIAKLERSTRKKRTYGGGAFGSM